MIPRQLATTLLQRLRQSPVVALLGSRQVGKTTLARELETGKPTHYLDLERPSDLAKLADAELYLSGFAGRLVILDEVQRVPDLFPVLRSLVDERRRAGEKAGHFLLLGSASPELLQQSAETLAGRISYLELGPLRVQELRSPDHDLPTHWERGGYPDSFLATDRDASLQWREDFITSYVERHLPQLGITAPPILLRRFCTMLAHQQGATINLSKLAGSLGIDGKTARRYLDLLRGSLSGAHAPAVEPQRRQTAGEVRQGLLARQRHSSRAGGTERSGAGARASALWRLVGRVLRRADSRAAAERRGRQPLPHHTPGRRWTSSSRRPTAKCWPWRSSAPFPPG